MAVAGSLKYEAVFDEDGILKGLKNVEKEAKKSSGIMDVALGNIVSNLSSMAADGLKEITSAGIGYNATIEQYETAFEVMLGSQELAVAKMQELVDLGASTPFEVTELADATQQLLAFGVESEDTTKYLTQLGDISQGSSEKLGSLVNSFGKMKSSGKVTLEYLNIMIEQGFNPLSLIAEETGESMSEMYDRVSEGGVSVEEVTKAFETATSQGGQFYKSMDKQSETFNGQLSTLKDNFNSFLGETFEPLFNFLSQTVLPAVNDLLTGANGFSTWISENETTLTLLAILIGTLTTAIIAYNIALNATAIAAGITATATAILTGVTTAFGAVMAFITSPITLVILAIGALIAIIYLLIKNWDAVSETAKKVWDSIVDTFKGAAKWFYDVVIDPIVERFKLLFSDIQAVFNNIKNIFSNIISFVKNVFTGNWAGAWQNIVNIFKNIFSGIGNIAKIPINFIIDAINSFIKSINKISIPDWVPGVGGKGMNIPTIPRLAKGGVVSKSTLANIGEAGAEAIVPLENNTNWTKQVAKLMYEAQKQEKMFNSNANVSSSYSNKGSENFEVTTPVVLELDTEIIYQNLQKVAFRKQIGGAV